VIHPQAVNDVSSLRTLIQTKLDASYVEKMFHPVPNCPTVKDRAGYMEQYAKGKIVLDIGCTGPLSARVRKAAATYYGVDREIGEWAIVDLDKNPDHLPLYPDVSLVIVSEVLEHLANPGRFLEVLAKRYPNIDTLITVPNAGAYAVREDCELVNKDHVSWYSYTTLHTLLSRYNYIVEKCRWYNGQPHKAEGLIVIAQAPASTA